MRKLLHWCKQHYLFVITLILLAFIPLYPKLPLININHVWVYIRLEDFMVLMALGIWFISILRKNVSFQTPLTLPILFFWLIGAISTFHGILFIFPTIQNVFPNVAFLSYLRRVEYMSLFFIAFTSFKEKRMLRPFIVVFLVTIVAVTFYGLGQKYFAFPAFLTMNEEFAKGLPLQLSSLGRISSTFGGHYDLAAFLVFTLPIVISLAFGFRNWILRSALLVLGALSTYVLFLTVSRISFLALFIALGFVLFLEKKQVFLVSIPIVLIAAIGILRFTPGLVDRFGNTVKEIYVLVDSKSGVPLGQVQLVPNSYFEGKVVKQNFYRSIPAATASPSAEIVVPALLWPKNIYVFVTPNAPTGENLPQGTGYINLPLSPVVTRMWDFFYETKRTDKKTGLPEVTIINGDYLVKKAFAYDLSFTTRFQGEWPNALTAFKRNIFLGSGYGSVSLAVDNSFLRMLAEVGIFGFASFFAIFLIVFSTIKKTLSVMEQGPEHSFIIGFIAGFLGLVINALFIDVFEASKVAYVLWLTTGVVMALAALYKKITFSVYTVLKRILTSPIAVIIYLLIIEILLYAPLLRNYFVGDDFTWLRWAAQAPVSVKTIFGYFLHADGFFYRPGAKIYFLLMYHSFWLNQNMYHIASLILHFVNASFIYLLARKLLKNGLLSAATAFLFLIISGYSEAVFWISATGFLFTTTFILGGLLSYIFWLDKKRILYFILTIGCLLLSVMFHELGIVGPILLLSYSWVFGKQKNLKLLLVIPFYLIVRFFAGSHWLSGDYSYNLLKLPLNFVGNAFGYFMLTFLGPPAISISDTLRSIFKNLPVVAGLSLLLFVVFAWFIRKYLKLLRYPKSSVTFFSIVFFVITLLPFLGLGNLTSRYSYIASVGLLFLLILGLKKLYEYLLFYGKDLAVTVIVLVVATFSLWQIVQFQQIHSDWYESGFMVERSVLSVESSYQDTWKTSPIELHFVNVPIRHGSSWVYPVGLSDALWFILQNPKITIWTWPSLDAAFANVQYGNASQHVFVFADNGLVTEVYKPAPQK